MMLPRTGNQLLLPLNPVFLWFSLFLAAALNLIPAGRHPAMPDFLALTLVVWNVHQPRRVGVGWAFAFGSGLAGVAALLVWRLVPDAPEQTA